MIKKILNWLITKFKTKQIELPKQSNTTDILQAATQELITRAEQVKEDRYFKKANNIIDEFVYEHPKLITPMGVYYKNGDKCNTYDPNVIHEIEDYDGRILRIGGKGSGTKEVYSNLDNDQFNDMPSNPELVAHIEKLRIEWEEKNKVVNYEDALKQTKSTENEEVNDASNQ